MNPEINQFNLSERLMLKCRKYISLNTHWHKIMVENVEGLDRDAVLKVLMESCSPLDFIPVHYEPLQNRASFLLKNCGEAITKLCNQKLIVVNPYDNDKPFKISIKLCFVNSADLTIDIQQNVTYVLRRRFNQDTGLLNLENFAGNSDLQEYCALSQKKLFYFVLDLAKCIQFKSLKLSNNNIEFLKPLEILEGNRDKIAIDLRNNNIKDISELAHIKNLNLSELWLEGNPVCDQYNDIGYGIAVGKQLERLEKLDGFNIQWKGFLPFRRNFLCNLTGYDLVDQFLEHYFTLYDAQNRSVLEAVYHKSAIFSLTCQYLSLQITSPHAQLEYYKAKERNLKNSIKTTQNLFLGPSAIIGVLNFLPFCEHDPYSFTVDLVMYTETTAVLVVCGVFRERSESFLGVDRLLGFRRTFVLLAGLNGEYSITNEMLHITNATTSQAIRSFKQVKIPQPSFIYLPQPQDTKERCDMCSVLKAITGLKWAWSRKCLEECKYDMRKALSLFIGLHKADKIPGSAFVSEQNPDVDEQEKWYNSEVQTVNSSTPNIHISYLPQLLTRNESPFNGAASVSIKKELDRTCDKSIEKTKVAIRNESPFKGTASGSLKREPDHICDKSTEKTKVPIRNESSFKGTASGSLKREPDRTWDKFTEKSKVPKMEEMNIVGCIDLLSSPESDEPNSKKSVPQKKVKLEVSKNVNPEGNTKNISNPQKDIESTVSKYSNPYGNPDKKTKSTDSSSKRQMKKLQEDLYNKQVQHFQLALKSGADREKIYQIANNLLRQFCDHCQAYEEVFQVLYQEYTPDARRLKDEVMKLAITEHKSRRAMNSTMIELLTNKYEYLYGSEVEGENAFKKMILERPRNTKPITDFCTVLLTKKKIFQARELMKPYSDTHHLLFNKMQIHVKNLETNFQTKLWYT